MYTLSASRTEQTVHPSNFCGWVTSKGVPGNLCPCSWTWKMYCPLVLISWIISIESALVWKTRSFTFDGQATAINQSFRSKSFVPYILKQLLSPSFDFLTIVLLVFFLLFYFRSDLDFIVWSWNMFASDFMNHVD